MSLTRGYISKRREAKTSRLSCFLVVSRPAGKGECVAEGTESSSGGAFVPHAWSAFPTGSPRCGGRVHSSSLSEVSIALTTIERTFDPRDVRRLEAASGSDLSFGGGIVAEAYRHGLFDDCVAAVVPGAEQAAASWGRLGTSDATSSWDHRRQRRGLRAPRGPHCSLTPASPRRRVRWADDVAASSAGC